VAGVGVLIVPALLMVMVMTGTGTGSSGGGCGDGVEAAGTLSDDELSEDQLKNASAIVQVGARMRIPRQGIVVALAAAHQESRFLNYANDGRGGDLRPDQAGIARSRELPHQAVGSDHGSLGVFQQQWPWWGSMSELMDPATSAAKFFQRLVEVPGWSTMAVTRAAQAVQRSAYPDAYADDQALAERLVDDAGLADVSTTRTVAAGECAGASCGVPDPVEGSVVTPLARSVPFTDRHNFGHSGGRWARGHTGTDLSAACGSPVRAVTAGTVVIKTDAPWAGTWLVEVSTGQGRLTTWYAHMQALDVSDGERVQAGQQIGEVGSRGNSTGCHLHFEVHPRGGSIYEDGVDPSDWLQEHAGSDVPQVQAAAAAPRNPASTGSGSFILASFNVLGSSHTAAGGKLPSWSSGEVRIRRAIRFLDAYDVEVVGLQEFQRPQRRAMLEAAGDRYAIYSPPGDTENSIAWRRDKWAMVSATTMPIPYFGGRIRRMPIVRLRNLASKTDAIFVNIHNPAETGQFRHQGRFRNEALRRERAYLHALTAQYDVPAFLTGDFNDRDKAFCAITTGGTMSASAGGSHVGHCRPPDRPQIDWIFGSGRSTWAGHAVVWTLKQRRITDHPLVLARVSTGSATGGGR
jgi:murein DD-endopeptidase MepM/ murein hydrolase activator NlpD